MSRLICTVSVIALLAGVAHADIKDDLEEGDRAYDDGNLTKAAKAYDNAIRQAPKQVPPAAFGKRCTIYFLVASPEQDAAKKKKTLEAGLACVSKAESIHGEAAEILAAKAVILWELKSKPDAIKAAEAAVAKDGSLYIAQRIIGEFYAVRDPARSIKAYEAYLANRPAQLEGGDVMPRINLGFAYLSQARKGVNVELASTKALTQFETLLQKHRKARNAEVNANNGLCTVYSALAQIDESKGNKQTRNWDKAITACERIIENPRAIDRGGSVYYNVGRAYLAKRQARKARTVGQEYIRMRKSEPRGYILVGDSLAQERNWTGALEWYQKAEDNAKASKEYAGQIGIRMGIAFRGAKQPERAIAKLEQARTNDPDNVEVIKELGLAYVANRQDDKALATVRKAIGAESFAKLDAGEKVLLLSVAGKASYNQALASGKGADEAQGYFEQAHKLSARDSGVRTGLVKAMTLQSYHAFKAKNEKVAETTLAAALVIDARNPAANQNMAALLMDRGKCDDARPYLAKLESERSYALVYHRLMGRAELCGAKRDPKAAAEHYAAAEKAAGNANLVRAEIYTEWAPLIWDKDLDDAVDKLEAAVQFTAQNPALGKPAERALALALFRRGWRTMRGGKKVADPVDDFQRASRNPTVLRGTEKIAFEFSEAMARLDKGDSAGAAKLFDSLGKQGNAASYLMPPYDKVGAQFFGAYAKYRSGNAAQMRQAAVEFQALLGGAKGKFGDKVRDLLASCYEHMAYEAIEGNGKNASASLDSAGKYASSGDMKRRIAHNKAVLKMGSKANAALRAEFTSMGSDPPEALVNKGIMLDREGNARGAYEAWQAAKAKGARGNRVNDWINTKKRLFKF